MQVVEVYRGYELGLWRGKVAVCWGDEIVESVDSIEQAKADVDGWIDKAK